MAAPDETTRIRRASEARQLLMPNEMGETLQGDRAGPRLQCAAGGLRAPGPEAFAVKLSILDLAHVPVGSDVSQALRNTLDLARHVDELGYQRYWLAEHHNMPGIASAATAVVIGQVAGGTKTHPRGRGRHHAAQSFAAGDRRAVRHARGAVSRAASTWAWVARRAPMGSPGARCAAIRARPSIFPTMCRSCSSCWARCSPGSACAPCPAPAAMCRCGFSAPASSAPSSPRSWACPTPSPRISRRPRCIPRCACTASVSSLRRSCRRPTPWRAAM